MKIGLRAPVHVATYTRTTLFVALLAAYLSRPCQSPIADKWTQEQPSLVGKSVRLVVKGRWPGLLCCRILKMLSFLGWLLSVLRNV